MTRELVRTALDAADAAAAIHVRYADRIESIRQAEKGQSDFVSEADLAAQDAALAVIRERFPDHAILAEENDGQQVPLTDVPGGSAAGRPLWVVDPLDGTTNFLHGHPIFAASVGVAVDGRSVAGAVVAPALGERWWAARGHGAFLNGERIKVSGARELRTALIGTGFPFKNLPLLPRYQDQLGRVLRSTAGIRRLGSAALDLCYVAGGRLDAFWEMGLSPWDVAAGIIIVEEAGGLVTTLGGSPLGAADGGDVLAANSVELHRALGGVVEESGGMAVPD